MGPGGDGVVGRRCLLVLLLDRVDHLKMTRFGLVVCGEHSFDTQLLCLDGLWRAHGCDH